MSTRNALDQLLQRFQHRWETDRQWRAAMSGVLALLSLVLLCSCVGLMGSTLSRVLGPAGLGLVDLGQPAGDSGTPNTGAKLVNGVLTFPTPTAVWTVGAVPAVSPIANSQTPIPSPTSPPTATPTPTPTSGPGCHGNCGGPPPTNVTLTVVGHSPSKWADGVTASISVHTSAPNDGYGFIMLFPTGQTWLSANTDPNGLQTDGSGNGTYTFTIPGGYCGTQHGQQIDVKTQVQEGMTLNYGPDAYIQCA
jgi:hypothetical protein